jgi:flagellar protein FlgJ
MPTEAQINFVRKYWNYAVKSARKYGHNPVYMLAQSIAERGYKGSTLSNAPYNNFFGITKGNWTGKTVDMGKLTFRVYPSIQDSFDDYAKLLTIPLYKGVVKTGSPEQFAQSIAYSPYISESNGDNRETYRKNILDAISVIGAIPKPLSLFTKVGVGIAFVGVSVWAMDYLQVINFKKIRKEVNL